MRRGFTLAEVLIALALTAIAVGIISEGVRQSLRFQESLENRRIERESMAAILSALRSRLETLVPVVLEADNGEDGEILFVGQISRLHFIAADPGYPSTAGLYEYQIEIRSDEDDETDTGTTEYLLVYRRAITDLESFGRADPGLFQSWQYTLPSRLDFGYGDSLESTSSSQWSDAQSYPALVTLSVGEEALPVLTVVLPQNPSQPENSTAVSQ